MKHPTEAYHSALPKKIRRVMKQDLEDEHCHPDLLPELQTKKRLLAQSTKKH